jgi:dienelactone hydrolase
VKWCSGIPDSTDSFWGLAPRIAHSDPTEYWRRVKCSVLAIHGGKDEHLPAEASLRDIQTALGGGWGNPDVTSKVFPGCDHAFRIIQSPGGRFQWPHSLLDVPHRCRDIALGHEGPA